MNCWIKLLSIKTLTGLLPGRKFTIVNRNLVTNGTVEKQDLVETVVNSKETNQPTDLQPVVNVPEVVHRDLQQAPQGDLRDNKHLPFLTEQENHQEEGLFQFHPGPAAQQEVQPPLMAEPLQQPQAHQPQADPPQVQPEPVPPQINAMALAFKPSSFNGLHPETANRWWQSFNRYAELAGIQGKARCSLLGLLLSGSAEIWFNSLPEQTS